jgi:IS5 family transposase
MTGHTIDRALEQVHRLTGKTPGLLAGDRGYRGQKQSGNTGVMIPGIPLKSDTHYKREKKRKLFCKRAGIEPRIGHLKSDHRLGRNFYKGLPGDAINIMLAAAAFNFKKAMRLLLWLIRKGRFALIKVQNMAWYSQGVMFGGDCVTF